MTSTQPPGSSGRALSSSLGASDRPSTSADSELAALSAELASLTGKVDALVGRIDALEPLAAIAGDTFDHYVARLRARGVDVDERLRVALEGIERLTRPELMRAIAPLTAPRAVTTLGALARALAAVDATRAPEIGLWGLWVALRQRPVRRAVGLVAEGLRALGSTLMSDDSTTPAHGALEATTRTGEGAR